MLTGFWVNIGLLFHSGQYLGVGILGRMVKCMLKFIEAVKLFLEWLFHFALTSSVWEFRLHCILNSIWYYHFLATLLSVSYCSLIWISLIIHDNEHFFLVLFVICISFLVTCLDLLLIEKLWLFSYCWVLKVLYA